jgi:hypothetical protein
LQTQKTQPPHTAKKKTGRESMFYKKTSFEGSPTSHLPRQFLTYTLVRKVCRSKDTQ